MGHTRPDWTTYGKMDTVFALFDLGELAVRLGSIDSFDRRGNVLFMEDFESGLTRWGSNIMGTGAALVWANAYSKSKAYSVKCTSGSDLSGYSKLRLDHRYPVLSKMGFEVGFSFAQGRGVFIIQARIYTGTLYYDYQARYDFATGEFQVLDDTGTWVTILSGLNLKTWAGYYHILKLVVDPEMDRYYRYVLDSMNGDLAAIGVAKPVSSASSEILLRTGIVGTAGNNDVAYLDDIIITQNEE